ncbi:MAG: hypothetical protein HC887_12415 [Desulfobacteraceae bacterium]|nr:hypothetical protein [Desulfobacteraceae bacterium]
MSYSDFKSIEDIQQKFNISVISGASLFSETEDIIPCLMLRDILQENVSLALNINTEKARSEMIIAPVLIEVRRIFERKISLFSGTEFNIDDSLGLTGFCDFILSGSPNQIFLKYPIVCITEAKNENIRSGYAQCIAEMIAAKLFNDKNSTDISYILGVVTTGSNWKFLKYENHRVFIDFDEYLISQISKILGILQKQSEKTS